MDYPLTAFKNFSASERRHKGRNLSVSYTLQVNRRSVSSLQLLIRELMPTLKEDAKVIIVYDGKFGKPSGLIWDDLDLKRNFSLGAAANHCMVMNDVMVQEAVQCRSH